MKSERRDRDRGGKELLFWEAPETAFSGQLPIVKLAL